MRIIAPFMQDEQALQRIANWYMGAFWLLVLTFYVSLVREGTEPALGMLTCCAAGIACLLVRRARILHNLSLNQILAEAVAPLAAFLMQANDLVRAGRDWRASVALMLVSIEGLDDPANLGACESVIIGLRRLLAEALDGPIFQIDQRTLALVDGGEDVVARFDKISDTPQRIFRSQRATTPSLTSARLTVGIAVADKGRVSAAQLFGTARAAVGLAEANRKDIFVRQI
jgi:hypothetical protein